MSRPDLNRGKAIREFCRECMGFYIEEVNRCSDRACPLWEWRRGPGSKDATDVALRHSGNRGSPGQ